MPADSTITLGEKSEMGVVRTDDDLARKNLTDVEETVATSDEFIIFGKASVEIFDRDTVSQKIEMEAFEETLEQFFAQGGNISYQHKDVVVGEAQREHELSSDVSVDVGDETLEFSEGDTLKTEVEDDTLWLVANIYGRDDPAGSDASVMTRLGAYRGELDGFSVTIKNKEYRNTPEGQVISDIDFHSVTVGTGEQIKNPDSLFGVAEFKLGEYLDTKLSFNTKNMELNILKKLRSQSTDAMSEETISHALTETYDLGESAKALTDGEGVEEVEEKAENRLNEIQDKAEDRQDLVSMLVDMTGLSSDEVNSALDEMLDADSEEEKAMDGDKDEDEMEEDEDDDMEQEADEGVRPHAEAIADMMDGLTVEDVMDMLDADEMESEEKADEADSDEGAEVAEKGLTEEDVEALIDEKMEDYTDEISEKLSEMEAEVAESVSERISEKMETGSTPEQDANPAEDGTRNLLNEW